ncbi:MAG: hypothetical protein K2X48_06810 [Chitinophagaceae bacterium]|nr:hypothetical protein [Chitinophagaceae bacterium]
MTPVLLVSSCITEKKIIHSKACYALEIIPGTVKASENDEGVLKNDTVVIVYIRSKRNDLQWDSAVVNGQVYKVTSQIISSNRYEAGINAVTGKKELITAAEGDVLYQLQFQKIKDQKHTTILNEITLHFRYKEKRFKTILNKPVFLLQHASV